MNDSVVRDLLVGDSKPMRELRARIVCVAASRLPVLVQGPTGSGKELVARAIHRASKRRGEFIPFNVAAVGESLFESMVFGHVKGAFSGAIDSLPGYLAESHGGTCFMDEIGTLPLGLQCKLLRALDQGEYRPIGARRDQRSDFRLVAATNESIPSLVEGGRFRPDLAFRISGFVIDVPPLSHRADDIPILVDHFAPQISAAHGIPCVFLPAALRMLQQMPWFGNVRELQHVVTRAALFADESPIGVETMRRVLDVERPHAAGGGCVDLDECERLRRVLEASGWNVTRAARTLALHPVTVYRRMKRLGIVRPRKDPPTKCA